MKSVELESVEELEREIVFVQSSEALKQKVLLWLWDFEKRLESVALSRNLDIG